MTLDPKLRERIHSTVLETLRQAEATGFDPPSPFSVALGAAEIAWDAACENTDAFRARAESAERELADFKRANAPQIVQQEMELCETKRLLAEAEGAIRLAHGYSELRCVVVNIETMQSWGDLPAVVRALEGKR